MIVGNKGALTANPIARKKGLFFQSVAERTNDTALYTYIKTTLTRQISLFVTVIFNQTNHQKVNESLSESIVFNFVKIDHTIDRHQKLSHGPQAGSHWIGIKLNRGFRGSINPRVSFVMD